MRDLPLPKDYNVLYIPNESDNIEDYVEFYLSIHWGYDDLCHPMLPVPIGVNDDYHYELYEFIQKCIVVRKHKLFYRKGKYGSQWFPLDCIDLVNKTNTLPLSSSLLNYLISKDLLSIDGNKGDEYIQYSLHWNAFIKKLCVEEFWIEFYIVQNKDKLCDTSVVKEYYRQQITEGKTTIHNIRELAKLYVPMPEDKEIEKKIKNEEGDRNSEQYKAFVKAVLKRDGYRCQCCGSDINPEVHHIKNYRQYKKLRTDVNNGITLCEMHHSMNIIGGFHQVYGTYNNTPEQLQEYLDKERYELGLSAITIEEIINPRTE